MAADVAHRTVVIDAKAWLATPTMEPSAAALLRSTSLVCRLYSAAVAAVACAWALSLKICVMNKSSYLQRECLGMYIVLMHFSCDRAAGIAPSLFISSIGVLEAHGCAHHKSGGQHRPQALAQHKQHRNRAGGPSTAPSMASRTCV